MNNNYNKKAVFVYTIMISISLASSALFGAIMRFQHTREEGLAHILHSGGLGLISAYPPTLTTPNTRGGDHV